MVTQRVEIELPESVYRQLAKVAQETAQPIETVAAQSVISNLPPSAGDVSPELHSEFLTIQTLDTAALIKVAQEVATSEQSERQFELLERHSTGLLTQAERQELSQLRQQADKLMLRKAYALSILRWRGQRVPTLEELPIPQ